MDIAIILLVILLGVGVGVAAHRVFGSSVWWILLLGLPIAICLTIAEIRIAIGPLSALYGTVQGAQILAAVLAIAILLAAHSLSGALHEYLDRDPNAVFYNPGFQVNRLTSSLLAFLVCAGAYFLLGLQRQAMLSATMDEAQTQFVPIMFLLYPLFDLLTTFILYPAFRACADHFRRFQNSKRRRLIAGSLLTGRVHPNLARTVLQNIHALETAGHDAEEYFAETRAIMGNFNDDLLDLTDRELQLPEGWALDADNQYAPVELEAEEEEGL